MKNNTLTAVLPLLAYMRPGSKGYGLFTKCANPANTFETYFTGHHITKEEFNAHMSKEYVYSVSQHGKVHYIDGHLSTSLSRLLNDRKSTHSANGVYALR